MNAHMAFTITRSEQLTGIVCILGSILDLGKHGTTTVRYRR